MRPRSRPRTHAVYSRAKAIVANRTCRALYSKQTPSKALCILPSVLQKPVAYCLNNFCPLLRPSSPKATGNTASSTGAKQMTYPRSAVKLSRTCHLRLRGRGILARGRWPGDWKESTTRKSSLQPPGQTTNMYTDFFALTDS